MMSPREGDRDIAAGADERTAGTPVAAWHRLPVAITRSPQVTYPATAVAVGAARRDVAEIARAAGASRDIVADVQLAVSEASTNAVVHAFTRAGTRGDSFIVATRSQDARLSVWVIDEGQGVTPDTPSPGIGLGLGLLARLCERLVIGVLEDGRTQIEMRFALQPAAPA
jgi:anti-sigma regulatory factor (Ser/Thr protein kinase)